MSSTISPNLTLGIDRADPTPLHKQVVAEIRSAITERQAAPLSGRLPPGTWPPCSP